MKHAQHVHEEKTADQAILERIADRLSDLLQPSSTHETQWVRIHCGPCPDPVSVPDPLPDDWRPEPLFRWLVRCHLCDQVLADGAGQRLTPVPHVVDRPSLIDQLEDAIESSSAGASSSGGFESRPAANLAALDTLGTIEREAAIWVRAITGRPAPSAARPLLELLAEKAPTAAPGRLRDLDFDVLRWWAHARVTTTWDSAPLKPHVPCMNCDRRGGIQVRVEPLSAVCLLCGAAWDSSTIGILGNHIQLMLSPPIDLEAETAAAAS